MDEPAPLEVGLSCDASHGIPDGLGECHRVSVLQGRIWYAVCDDCVKVGILNEIRLEVGSGDTAKACVCIVGRTVDRGSGSTEYLGGATCRTDLTMFECVFVNLEASRSQCVPTSDFAATWAYDWYGTLFRSSTIPCRSPLQAACAALDLGRLEGSLIN